jgi:D-tyrosyl-tRNA(Tyr) deacylase
MRAVIQRVSKASVHIGGQAHASIGKGLLIFLGIEAGDGAGDLGWLAAKIVRQRIFEDAEGRMNLSLPEISGETLIISQFTLHASTQKGSRPSFHRAEKPERARELYEAFVEEFAKLSGGLVKTGIFAADMQVELVNDGPVTLILDSRLKE